MVSEYSLETYQILKQKGYLKQVQERAYQFVLYSPGKTILDFEKATGIKHQSASGAYSKLTRKKKFLRISGAIKQEGFGRGTYEVTDRRSPAVEEKKPSNIELLDQLISEIRAENPSGDATMFTPFIRDEILNRMTREGRRAVI